MKKNRVISAFILLLLFVFSSSAVVTAEEKKIRLRIESAFPLELAICNPFTTAMKQLEENSGGSIEVKLYNPGAIVPAFQIQEAVSKGQIEGGFSVSFYLSGQLPASPFFTSFPFGPTALEYMGWYEYGNGKKLYQEMYDRKGFNVKVFPTSGVSFESGGWFTKPINTVEDLKGLRLRWPGLGGKVLSNLGASISAMPVGEVFTALERGVIDGTELGSPMFDVLLGFYKVAKYNYFPGWHQPASSCELTINKDVWNSMSKRQQSLVEQAASSCFIKGILNQDVHSGPAMRKNAEKYGVHNMIYPPEVLKAFQITWLEIVAEKSAKDPFFKKVWDDISAFMKDYGIWEAHSYRAMPARKFK